MGSGEHLHATRSLVLRWQARVDKSVFLSLSKRIDLLDGMHKESQYTVVNICSERKASGKKTGNFGSLISTHKTVQRG